MKSINGKFVTAGLLLSTLVGLASAATLKSPEDGSYLKSPTITYKVSGSFLTRFATIQLSGPHFSQSDLWPDYLGTSFTQILTRELPNNAWVTASLIEGKAKSSKRLWTAFPWKVPKSIETSAKKDKFVTFEPGWCTNFAARAFHSGPSITASYAPWRGDAQGWIVEARNAGWKTTSSPKGGYIGAVVVWSGGAAGHVGVVVDMNKNGANIEYVVKHMNWGDYENDEKRAQGITKNFGKVTEAKVLSTTMKPSASSKYKFVGFILPVRSD